MSSFEELHTAGIQAFNEEKFEEAIDLFIKALELEPDNVDALVYLGISYMQDEQYNNAVDMYSKAIEIDTNNYLAWENLGLAFDLVKDFRRAAEAHGNAAMIRPDNPEIWDNLGLSYLNLKEYGNAIQAYKNMLNDEQKYNFGAAAIEFLIEKFKSILNLNEEEVLRFYFEAQSEINVFLGMEPLYCYIGKCILETKSSITIISPEVIPDFLQLLYEHAVKNKEMNKEISINIACTWDKELYSEVIIQFLELGNVQLWHLNEPSHVFSVFRDNEELLISPLAGISEGIVSIASVSEQYLNTFSNFVYMFLGMGLLIKE